ncbi:MAG: calcium-binding protein [Leisingera sp.]
MVSVTANSASDLINLSRDNFWFMGNLARGAFGSTYISGDTFTNQRLGAKKVLFEGNFRTYDFRNPDESALHDPVYAISILDDDNNKVLTLSYEPGSLTENDLRQYEARGDAMAFSGLLRGNDRFDLSDERDLIGGFAGNDLIYGHGGNDRLEGNEGRDTIFGGLGRDNISGNSGHDRLFGDEGNDTLRGDTGNDTLTGWVGNDLLKGGGDNDELLGGAGDDILKGEWQNDFLNGGTGKDKLFGGTDDDTLNGGIGNDSLFGNSGNDQLAGDGGKDKLVGGSGLDTLEGGLGNDALTGGKGADTFVCSSGDGQDTIVDFEATKDAEKIDLSGVGKFDSFNKGFVSRLSQQASDVLIDLLNGDTILLQDVDIAELGAEDFLF